MLAGWAGWLLLLSCPFISFQFISSHVISFPFSSFHLMSCPLRDDMDQYLNVDQWPKKSEKESKEEDEEESKEKPESMSG